MQQTKSSFLWLCVNVSGSDAADYNMIIMLILFTVMVNFMRLWLCARYNSLVHVTNVTCRRKETMFNRFYRKHLQGKLILVDNIFLCVWKVEWNVIFFIYLHFCFQLFPSWVTVFRKFFFQRILKLYSNFNTEFHINCSFRFDQSLAFAFNSLGSP